jgi:hypothetical protein
MGSLLLRSRTAEAGPFRPVPRIRAMREAVPVGYLRAGRGRNANTKALQSAEADARTRTADPFITSEVLYQLSYVGADRHASGVVRRG